MRTVQMKLIIATRNKENLVFPSERKQDAKASKTVIDKHPTDDEIRIIIGNTAKKVANLLVKLGCKADEIDFNDSLRGTEKIVKFEFISFSEIESIDSEATTGVDMKACEPQVDLSFESSFRDTEGVTGEFNIILK